MNFLHVLILFVLWWEMSNGGVIEMPEVVKLSKDINRIAFHLYPFSTNLNFHQTLIYGNPDTVVNSEYNKSLPLILLIHGFLTSYEDKFAQTIKNQFLSVNYPANIVAVDWEELSTPEGSMGYLFYSRVVDNVPLVASRISAFIAFMIQISALSSLANLHIIGFSLGAHVAGITGKNVRKDMNGLVGRITGLDPAGPLYGFKKREERIDRTDAAFVDIVHSNQGLKGYHGLLGHVDFFPNGGGPFQPGCSNISDFSDIFNSVCSHGRAFEFYAKSIRNRSMTACKCSDGSPELRIQNKDMNIGRIYVNDKCRNENICSEPLPFGHYCPSKY